MLRPLTDEEAKKRYGDFTWVRIDNSGKIKITDQVWLQQNLSPVLIPQLKGKPVFGKTSSGKVYCHRLAHSPLKAVFAEIDREGLLDNVVSYDGTFNSRMVRGSRKKVSRHSYGIAIDLNAAYNPLGQFGAELGEHGTVLRLVPIFERHGFVWGGHFERPDWMHFELGFKEKDVVEEGGDKKMALIPTGGKSRTKSKTIWFNAITAGLAMLDAQFGVLGLVQAVPAEYLLLAVSVINWIIREKTSEPLKPLR